MADHGIGGSRTSAFVTVLALLVGLGATALGVGADAAGADTRSAAPTTPAASKPPTPPGTPDQLGNLAEDPQGTAPGSYHNQRRPAGTIQPRTLTASTPPGTPLGKVNCQGYSGTERSNPRDQAIQDIMTFPPFDPVKVGDGKGNINWALDPHKNPSWTLWLLDLRWIGSLLISYEHNNDQAALAHAEAVTKSFIANIHPADWAKSEAAEGRAHRSEVLICLALDTDLAQWVVDALDTHAAYLQTHYSGYSNHGVDEDLALLQIGCLLGRRSYADYAASRLDNTVAHLVDTQGVHIEQSAGYQAYTYQRLTTAQQRLKDCGEPVPQQMSARVSLMPRFLAHSTMPDGTIPLIGDSQNNPQYNFPGTEVEYAATKGTSGTPPQARQIAYRAGYAFGRSTWTPFTGASWYSLRWGPPRILHGHMDHTSLLYFARGHQILTDAGFYGYVNSWPKSHTVSTEANNVLTVAGLTYRNVATSLTRAASTANSDFYEVSDAPAAGLTRARSVLVSRSPDVALVMDRASSKTARGYRQLWHLMPDSTVTVSGRALAAAVPADHSGRTYIFQVTLKGQTLPPGSTGVVKGQKSPIVLGWQAPSTYRFVPAPVVQMARTGTSMVYLTLVVPTRYNAKISISSFRQGTDGYYAMVLLVDGQPVTFRISGGGYMSRTK